MLTFLLVLVQLYQQCGSIVYGTIDYSCKHTSSWIQGSTTYNSVFGKTTDIINVTYDSSNSNFIVGYYGIPNYDHPFDATDMTRLADHLTNKPSDFKNPNTGTTAVEGTNYVFGDDIGYATAGCGGFWPVGPTCPGTSWKTTEISLIPRPEGNSNKCYALSGKQGVWVNGVYLYVWGDGSTYNDDGVWSQLALEFEKYAMDVCAGHAAGNKGLYHHHSYSRCLKRQLQDDGTAHSPIYGWVEDGYPIHGPYQSDGVLAKSCWTKRDYSSSTTGCSDGKRSCIFVDEYDYTKGTTTATSNGPDPSGTTTSTTVTISAASGIYYQDYYYNSTCGNLGGAYLNSYNAHDHDNLGLHYHVTIDTDEDAVFPYVAGPKFYGCLPSSKTCCTEIDADNTCKKGTISTCATTTQGVDLSTAQCTDGVSTFTFTPTNLPTVTPTLTPTVTPSLADGETYKPTTRTPTRRPSTAKPTSSPTFEPTVEPTNGPSYKPSKRPSANTEYPTFTPTNVPTAVPSTATPTTEIPSRRPTRIPTKVPSKIPTSLPTAAPSFIPTSKPSTAIPTVTPTAIPSTASPTVIPTTIPSHIPSIVPTKAPTAVPSTVTPSTSVPTYALDAPTPFPSTAIPTYIPSVTPTIVPTAIPTRMPTSRMPTTVTPTAPTVISTTSNPTSKPTIFVKEDFLKFDVKVMMNGFPSKILDDQTQYVLILAVATATQLLTDEVTMVYTAKAENALTNIRKLILVTTAHTRRLITTYSMDILYTITTRISAYQDVLSPEQIMYQSISTSFQESVSSGEFEQILVDSCSSNCSVDFSTTEITDVVIYRPEQYDGTDNNASNALLSLIALFVLVAPCYYYYYRRNKIIMKYYLPSVNAVIPNEVESDPFPFKWTMKNIDYNPDADEEVMSAKQKVYATSDDQHLPSVNDVIPNEVESDPFKWTMKNIDYNPQLPTKKL